MFNILNQFDCNYDESSVWNCRFCTNLYNGCKKCQIKSTKEYHILCRSFQYYVFHKIRCECLGKGCKYCKYQGFIVERIHNYKNHSEYYKDDSNYKDFNIKYTIIDEEDWNHFKCLSAFFIPPSEKERLRNDILTHDKFRRILSHSISKLSDSIIKKLKNNEYNRMDSQNKS